MNDRESEKRMVDAMELARTLTNTQIEESRLLLPCDFCGAKPQQDCRSTRNPAKKARMHSSRGAILWAMWHKGYRAGRERGLADRK